MVRVSDLYKYYGGKRALGPVSFEISFGRTVGFVGLNGVGKTTLLRILAGDLRPSAGSVTVGEVDAVRNPHEARKRVGFLPEVPPLYDEMTVRSFLRFAGRLRGMEEGRLKRRIPEVEAVTRVAEVSHRLVRELSQGYRQRVGVAQAIVHEPDLLILDEPTHDLDPVQIVEMRNMIRGLRRDHTILISSHILPEISETCDRLLVLDDGVILAQGSQEDLSSSLQETRRVRVTVRPVAEEEEIQDAECRVRDAIEAVDGVQRSAFDGRDGDGLTFVVDTEGDRRAELSRGLVEAGYGVIRLDRERRELEGVFLRLMEGSAEAIPGGDDA